MMKGAIRIIVPFLIVATAVALVLIVPTAFSETLESNIQIGDSSGEISTSPSTEPVAETTEQPSSQPSLEIIVDSPTQPPIETPSSENPERHNEEQKGPQEQPHEIPISPDGGDFDKGHGNEPTHCDLDNPSDKCPGKDEREIQPSEDSGNIPAQETPPISGSSPGFVPVTHPEEDKPQIEKTMLCTNLYNPKAKRIVPSNDPSRYSSALIDELLTGPNVRTIPDLRDSMGENVDNVQELLVSSSISKTPKTYLLGGKQFTVSAVSLNFAGDIRFNINSEEVTSELGEFMHFDGLLIWNRASGDCSLKSSPGAYSDIVTPAVLFEFYFVGDSNACKPKVKQTGGEFVWTSCDGTRTLHLEERGIDETYEKASFCETDENRFEGIEIEHSLINDYLTNGFYFQYKWAKACYSKRASVKVDGKEFSLDENKCTSVNFLDDKAATLCYYTNPDTNVNSILELIFFEDYLLSSCDGETFPLVASCFQTKWAQNWAQSRLAEFDGFDREYEFVQRSAIKDHLEDFYLGSGWQFKEWEIFPEGTMDASDNSQKSMEGSGGEPSIQVTPGEIVINYMPPEDEPLELASGKEIINQGGELLKVAMVLWLKRIPFKFV
ncbi:MAG: hypothetical protein HYW25_01830 [Candidatus Aenigmarchaeota archaeon]|nr:hypothetical protein [Candidatus Aenigmarchaeota archaeon]